MSVTSQQVTKPATARPAQPTTAVMNHGRGLGGNHTLMRKQSESSHGFGRQFVNASEASRFSERTGTILQRKCACGSSSNGGDCEECKKHEGGKLQRSIQTKLAVSEPGDRYEQEADRVADQVLAASPQRAVSVAPPRIQRFVGQSTRSVGTASASVDSVLAGAGRPLETTLRQDMEHRFGYDFSAVRVHSGAVAAQSAREVNAHAYTTGTNVVFGAGRFAPETHEGRRLIAHELTHVVQQSGQNGIRMGKGGLSPMPQVRVNEPTCALVQRPPAGGKNFDPTLLEQVNPKGPGGFGAVSSSSSGFDPLYFFEDSPELPCPNCHQKSERSNFARRPTKPLVPVNAANIIEWAVYRIWNLTTNRKLFFSWLQRKEDEKLDAIWNSHRKRTVSIVASGADDNDNHRQHFQGSANAKSVYATILNAHWNEVMVQLQTTAVEWLVAEMVLAKKLVPRVAELVTKPELVAQIEDHPRSEKAMLEDGTTVTAGFEWGGKRLRSVVEYVNVFFEVIDHPGIYFNEWTVEFTAQQPRMGKIFTDVAKAMEGLAVAGRFIKGVFNAIAGIPLSVIDAAAKLVDMEVLAMGVFGQETGWFDISYECLSSTCKQYEAGVAQSDLILQSFKDASVVIPIYEQGKACFKGDAEACGELAGGAILAIYPKGPRGLRGLEESVVRQAIDRPVANELASEKAHPVNAESSPKLESEPALKGGHAEKATIDAFAEKHGIGTELLEAEVNELRQNAGDPKKVQPSGDPHFDAEMSTSDDHSFRRRKREKKDRWCRSSEEEACGLSMSKDVDAKVDATLQEVERATEKNRATSKVNSPIDAKEARRAQIAKRAEKIATDRSKAEYQQELKSSIENLESQVERNKSLRLRIQKEMAAIDESRKSGPKKTANKAELRNELKRASELGEDLENQLGKLQIDPKKRLRVFSYFDSEGNAVIQRAHGYDEYSLLPGTEGVKIKVASIDHVYAVDRIFDLDGFWDLFEDDQKAILSLPFNLKLMEQVRNSSKGGQRMANWKEGKRFYGEETFKAMVDLERDNGVRIQAEIAKKLKIRRRSTSAK